MRSRIEKAVGADVLAGAEVFAGVMRREDPMSQWIDDATVVLVLTWLLGTPSGDLALRRAVKTPRQGFLPFEE